MSTGGTDLFTILTFQICSPNTTPSAVASFFAVHLPAIDHGWSLSPYFPDDGGLMQSCVVRCWFDALSLDRVLAAPRWYLVFDDFAVQGQNAVIYRGRIAEPPPFPACAQHYASSPTPNYYYYLPDYTPAVPLPPLTFMAPDNATQPSSYTLCSPGTAASVSAFMTRELPATGWKQVSGDMRCVYEEECWTNGGSALSWSVGSSSVSNWHIAWRTS
jgi:hypothetical protein